MKIELTINGELRSFDVPANMLLLTLLRGAGYFSVKHGCETGECGACCVLVDGRAMNSCLLLAAQVHRREIFTLEGLNALAGDQPLRETGSAEPKTESSPAALHPLQDRFVEASAIQCGYCTPGMILSVLALFAEKGLTMLPGAKSKSKTPRKQKPTRLSEAEIRDAMAGNLCRCTGYVKPVEAVAQAATIVESQ